MSSPTPDPGSARGGLARYCVEHRSVAWLVLGMVLIWGTWAYTRLPQQEDPEIPRRRAVLVTPFPGAGATKVEALVTRKLEEKLNELECLEEIKSQSRLGVSILHLTQRPARRAVVEQEWDRIRARVAEVRLPDGCGAPRLDTDFGNTVTLLFALASPPACAGEVTARAALIGQRLQRLRAGEPAVGRAAVFAFFPPDIEAEFQTRLQGRFVEALLAAGVATAPPQFERGTSFLVADFATATNRAGIEAFLERFQREVAGSDGALHPDFLGAGVVMGESSVAALREEVRRITPPRYGYRELERAAEALRDELKRVASVGRVRLVGNVPEVVYLLYSLLNVEGYRLDPALVIQAIATRNAIIPGGVLRTEGQSFPVQLTGEFGTVDPLEGRRRFAEDLRQTVIGAASPRGLEAWSRATAGQGLPVYLRDLFEVRPGYENPISFQVDVLHRTGPDAPLEPHRAVLLAVEMKSGHIIGRFDREVQAVVEAFEGAGPPRLPEGVEVLRLSDQPAAVAHRIGLFTRCFFEAVGVVVLVALWLMDGRSALVVAAAIPLTLALTLIGMHLVGVPLHQISIASLILALGMLVDDPVVASDGINRELAHGQPRGVAAWLGPFKLRRAILFATLINIAAFLPLAGLPGDKGAFIWALPAVVTLALAASRLVSVTFVPLLGYYLLRGQAGWDSGPTLRTFPLFRMVDRALATSLPWYRRALERALERPGRVLVGAYGLLVLSFGLVPWLGQQFFPPAERNQLVVDIELPGSASIVQTREVCREVMTVLAGQPEIRSAAVFSGGTAPQVYYNLSPREPAPFLGQVLINTWRADQVPVLLPRLREQLDRSVAGARCVVRQLEQGPPVEAPLQVRLTGPDLDTLRRLADAVASSLRAAGAYQVHDDLGRRVPTLQIDTDQERANSLGISNARIGELAQSAFLGLSVTELRDGDHLIPVVIRLRAEDRNEADKIHTLYVRSGQDELVSLDSIARLRLTPEYATVAHFNQLRAVTVKAYAPAGELASRVLQRARAGLRALALPAGYRLELAGEDKELRQSRAEMGGVMAVSLALITLALVAQFHAVTKAAVVLLTVPLGLIGAFAGLTLLQAPLGFMALLGIVSLAGVMVSHIIVLNDFIEEALAQRMELKAALVRAGLVRLRAVLVTVLATVGGLVPLTLAGGELWRPLTAVHIFGLLLATALTLLVMPTWYYLFAARLGWIALPPPRPAASPEPPHEPPHPAAST